MACRVMASAVIMGCLVAHAFTLVDAMAGTIGASVGEEEDLPILSEITDSGDDECLSEDCALSALQVRAAATKSTQQSSRGEAEGEAENEDEAAAEAEETEEIDQDEAERQGSYHRRRAMVYVMKFGKVASNDVIHHASHRRRLVVYRPTKMYTGPQQPQHCGRNTTTLRKGYEGCCFGQSYEFSNTGCCGELLFRTDQLSCCQHGDGTATIYDRLTQNCCSDPRVDNKGTAGDLCTIDPGQPACCKLLTGRRRRHHTASLLEEK